MERIVMLLGQDNAFQQQCPRAYLEKKRLQHAVELEIVADLQQVREALRSADIFVGSEVPGDAIGRAMRLVWIHALSAGVERIMVPEVCASDIRVTNSAGTMVREVAEHAFALMLALTRRVDLAAQMQMRRRWANIRRDQPPISLNGLTLGIVGYGRIGKELAKLAKPFGMRVLGLRRLASEPDQWVDSILGSRQLPQLLANSDIVVVTLPLTPETEGLFSTEQFRAMRRHAYFINVARGAIVSEPALLWALRKRVIAGAANDVFVTEPLPPESELWDVPGLLMTPHLGGASQHVWFQVIDLFFDNLTRLREGKALRNLIDKRWGY